MIGATAGVGNSGEVRRCAVARIGLVKPKELNGGGNGLIGNTMVRGQEILGAGLGRGGEQATGAQKCVAVFNEGNSRYRRGVAGPVAITTDVVVTTALLEVGVGAGQQVKMGNFANGKRNCGGVDSLGDLAGDDEV